jgi:hypothetical protein
MATLKKVKKAQVGIKKPMRKSYTSEENSRAWAENERRVTGPKGPKTTSAQNASEWAQNERKVTSKKIDKNEKLTTPLKKGGKVTKAKAGKQMIKRADGSTSQRGLWDNIRAAAKKNKATGAKPKAPTKTMLSQEKKIKAKSK